VQAELGRVRQVQRSARTEQRWCQEDAPRRYGLSPPRYL